MSDSTYAIPELREELDRKVMATLEWLITGYAKGRLTEHQVSTGMDALFMAVSGLVDNDFIQIITEAQNECATASPVLKRHFHATSSDETLTFCWSPGADKVSRIQRICGQVASSKTTEYDSAEDAARVFRTVHTVMEKKGWIEL